MCPGERIGELCDGNVDAGKNGDKQGSDQKIEPGLKMQIQRFQCHGMFCTGKIFYLSFYGGRGRIICCGRNRRQIFF